MALRAQGYTLSGQEQWHNSSAYYITLHGAGGENLNEQYAKTQGAIGAFLGGELRGVSQVLETPGGRVFLIRVWGDENDGPTATLRLHSGYLEYEVGTLPFKGDGDNTYGEPSNPLEVTVIPAEEMVIDNTSVTVLRGSTQTVTASLLPENHSAIVTPLSYVFSSSDTAIFTVENDGPVCTIKGVALGQGTLTAKVVAGERTVFQTGAHVSVTTDAVHVSGIESDGPTDLTKTVGDQFQLKFVVKPENATNRRVEYTVGDLSILNIIQENETAPATFVAVKAGQTTITVRTVDGGYTLTYNVTVEDLPTVHVESITVDPASVEIFIDETFNFSYTVLPADAADKSVDIAVEDKSIVQLQDDGSYKGLKAGTTRIVVTSKDNPEVSAAVSVTVKEKPVVVIHVESITVDPASVEIFIDETFSFSYTVLPADAADKSVDIAIEDESIVQLQDDGSYKGLKAGTTRIVVTSKDNPEVSAAVSVTVKEKPVVVVHVESITVDPASVEIFIDETFSFSYTVLPADADDKSVDIAVEDESIVQLQDDGSYKGLKAGTTRIVVTSKDNPEVSAAVSVTVKEKPVVVIHVESITVDPSSVEIFIDETFSFSYTVLPADAADKSVDIAVEDESIVQLQDDGSYKGLKAGTTRIVVTSRDNPQASAAVSVTVKATVPVTIAFSAGDVVLSKLRDAAITLTATEPAKVNPAKVELVFPDHANNGWGAVGTATKTDASGLRWSARANYVGNYTLRIRYNGELQASTCNVHVPAEYALQNGWQWMSFYAVGAAGEFNPQSATLFIDDDNFVSDIRTQQAVLHYDPDYNYFGDLTRLAPADGFFKVFTHTDDDHDGQLLLNLGYTNLLTGQSLPQRQAAPGYTWLTYPHELSHQLTTLAPYLAQTAAEGDMIIGQDDFAEFDGDNWQADDSFILEAGKGYIYYTESTQPKTVNWGPATLAPEVMGNMPARVEDKMVTDLAGTACVASAYPDVMPIVARIDNALLTEGTTVIAMVDGMARAAGRMTPDGLIHLAVAGTTGQVVSFALADTDGNTVPLPLQLPFATRAGSHSSPVELSVASVAVSQQQTEQNFDLQGRRITEQRSSLQHGVYFINGKKVIK